MMYVIIPIMLSFCGSEDQRGDPALPESPAAYRIVADAAVSVLPDPLRILFGRHSTALHAAAEHPASMSATAADGDGHRKSTANAVMGDCRSSDAHYVTLDVAARDAGFRERQEAARRFPHDIARARRLFDQHDQPDGGSLPWVILQELDAVETNIAEPDPSTLIPHVGALIHFVTDASLPLNTTTLGRMEGGALRERLQVYMLDRLRARLNFEVRVVPSRYRPVDAPAAAVFRLLLDAHGDLEVLLSADSVQCGAIGASGNDLSNGTTTDYECLRLAEDSAAGVLESRLEAAAVLSAGLIGAAWENAGRPVFINEGAGVDHRHADAPISAPVAESPNPSAVTGQGREGSSDKTPAGAFVGSRNSAVFHLASCPHAGRIKPANRVVFDSVGEAIQAGRKPCKTCRPDAD